jgi:hypothetical protein
MKCPICLEKINNKITLLCFHNFCNKCYNIWFKIKNKKNCPVCRKKVFVEEDDDNFLINNDYYTRYTKNIYFK